MLILLLFEMSYLNSPTVSSLLLPLLILTLYGFRLFDSPGCFSSKDTCNAWGSYWGHDEIGIGIELGRGGDNTPPRLYLPAEPLTQPQFGDSVCFYKHYEGFLYGI